jgi:alpha-glucosidase
VRAGSILTLGNRRESTAEPLTELTVAVYPGRAGAWTLIEDDGESLAYREGMLVETTFHLEEEAGAVTVSFDARRGRFTPHPRELVVELHLSSPPRAILRDGRPVPDWRWDGKRRRAELRWPDDGAEHLLEALLETD